jgi:hypothetical protein
LNLPVRGRVHLRSLGKHVRVDSDRTQLGERLVVSERGLAVTAGVPDGDAGQACELKLPLGAHTMPYRRPFYGLDATRAYR